MNDPLRMYADRLDTSDGQLHILCPAGIGDFAWIWSKWHAVAKERTCTFWFPDGEQHRAAELGQLLAVGTPSHFGYLQALSTEFVWSQPGDPTVPDTGDVLVVHPNKHLEAGHRIERWYPELPFIVPKPVSPMATYHRAARVTTNYVVAFMCHAGYMEGNLMPGIWARILQMIQQEIAPVLIVGKDNDIGLADKVLRIFTPAMEPAFNLSLTSLLPYIEDARMMIGPASGLTILATYLGVPTFHAYPRWLKAMPGTWEQEDARTQWAFLDELEEAVRASLVAHGSTRLDGRRSPAENTEHLLPQHDAEPEHDRQAQADVVVVPSEKEAPAFLAEGPRQTRRLRHGNGRKPAHGSDTPEMAGVGAGETTLRGDAG